MRQFLLASFLLLATSAFSTDFKVVGYLAYWNFGTYPDKIEWDRLTHLNLAFANPDPNGDFQTEGADIDQVVQIAHQHGVKVFISLAGGYLTPEWESAWNAGMQLDQLPVFIPKIISYVQAHQLDGVDLDLEWQYVTDLYSPFVLALKTALDDLNMPLTAALPGGYRYPQITPAALAAFDWVNLMVYDLTGPWSPDNPGQHSPYSWAENCLQYWQNEGLPGERQVLGVPFYGYNFAVSPVDGVYFREMVALDVNNAYLDQVGQTFYNGIPTIQAKAQLAKDQASGVMIWELGQDAYDDLSEYSLLRAIDEALNPGTGATETLAGNLRLFPNPATDFIHVEAGFLKKAKLQVVDLQGKVWVDSEALGSPIPLEELPVGMYFAKITSGDTARTARFVKI